MLRDKRGCLVEWLLVDDAPYVNDVEKGKVEATLFLRIPPTRDLTDSSSGMTSLSSRPLPLLSLPEQAGQARSVH